MKQQPPDVDEMTDRLFDAVRPLIREFADRSAKPADSLGALVSFIAMLLSQLIDERDMNRQYLFDRLAAVVNEILEGRPSRPRNN